MLLRLEVFNFQKWQHLDIDLSGGMNFVVGDTDAAGIHRLTAGTNRIDFTVNLLSPEESNIKPSASLSFGKYTKIESTQASLGNKEIWKYFAMAALGLLLLEWWYYHRRTARLFDAYFSFPSSLALLAATIPTK